MNEQTTHAIQHAGATAKRSACGLKPPFMQWQPFNGQSDFFRLISANDQYLPHVGIALTTPDLIKRFMMSADVCPVCLVAIANQAELMEPQPHPTAARLDVTGHGVPRHAERAAQAAGQQQASAQPPITNEG
jgi:hypothetical protein